jgi:hypothetical protein
MTAFAKTLYEGGWWNPGPGTLVIFNGVDCPHHPNSQDLPQ